MRTVRVALALTVALLCTCPPEASAAAASPAAVATSSPGVRFETAARAAADGDLAPARLLAETLGGGDKVEGMTPGAALLLRGSLADLLGDHRAAATLFRQAGGREADTDWREAADYLAHQSLEAAGDDDAARAAWTRWSQDHPNGRLSDRSGPAPGLAAVARRADGPRREQAHDPGRRRSLAAQRQRVAAGAGHGRLSAGPARGGSDLAGTVAAGRVPAVPVRPVRSGARPSVARGRGVPGGGDPIPAVRAARSGLVRQGQHVPGRGSLAQRGRGLRHRGRSHRGCRIGGRGLAARSGGPPSGRRLGDGHRAVARAGPEPARPGRGCARPVPAGRRAGGHR